MSYIPSQITDAISAKVDAEYDGFNVLWYGDNYEIHYKSLWLHATKHYLIVNERADSDDVVEFLSIFSDLINKIKFTRRITAAEYKLLAEKTYDVISYRHIIPKQFIDCYGVLRTNKFVVDTIIPASLFGIEANIVVIKISYWFRSTFTIHNTSCKVLIFDIMGGVLGDGTINYDAPGAKVITNNAGIDADFLLTGGIITALKDTEENNQMNGKTLKEVVQYFSPINNGKSSIKNAKNSLPVIN